MALDLGLEERLVKARKDVGINQKEMAKRLNVSVMTLNRYERGSRTPDIHFLSRMADLISCCPEWLIRGKTSQSNPPAISESEREVYERLLAAKDKIIAMLESKDACDKYEGPGSSNGKTSLKGFEPDKPTNNNKPCQPRP